MTEVRKQVAIESLQRQIAFEENWNAERLARIAENEAKSRELEAKFNERLADEKSLMALELVAQRIDNCVKEISDDKSRIENTKNHIEILKKNLAEMEAENAAEEIDASENAVSADAQVESAKKVEEERKAKEDAEKSAAEFKYYLKSNRPIYGAVPSGYINAEKVEIRVPRKGYFYGVATYDKPLIAKQILDYDLRPEDDSEIEKVNNYMANCILINCLDDYIVDADAAVEVEEINATMLRN